MFGLTSVLMLWVVAERSETLSSNAFNSHGRGALPCFVCVINFAFYVMCLNTILNVVSVPCLLVHGGQMSLF